VDLALHAIAIRDDFGVICVIGTRPVRARITTRKTPPNARVYQAGRRSERGRSEPALQVLGFRPSLEHEPLGASNTRDMRSSGLPEGRELHAQLHFHGSSPCLSFSSRPARIQATEALIPETPVASIHSVASRIRFASRWHGRDCARGCARSARRARAPEGASRWRLTHRERLG